VITSPCPFLFFFASHRPFYCRVIKGSSFVCVPLPLSSLPAQSEQDAIKILFLFLSFPLFFSRRCDALKYHVISHPFSPPLSRQFLHSQRDNTSVSFPFFPLYLKVNSRPFFFFLRPANNVDLFPFLVSFSSFRTSIFVEDKAFQLSFFFSLGGGRFLYLLSPLLGFSPRTLFSVVPVPLYVPFFFFFLFGPLP